MPFMAVDNRAGNDIGDDVGVGASVGTSVGELVGVIDGVSEGVAVVGVAAVGIGYDVGDSVRKPRNIPILCNVRLSDEEGTGTGAGGSAAFVNFDVAESTAELIAFDAARRRNDTVSPPPDGANSNTRTMNGITTARNNVNIFCRCCARYFLCLSSA
jgi:hypothetical protein